MDRERLIDEYFKRGYTYKEIQAVLCYNHDINISLVQLKRIIKNLGLHRRGHHSNLQQVVDYISSEVEQSGQQHGYRFMCRKLRKAGYTVTERMVMYALQLIDPEGVNLRKRRRLIRRRYYSKGPNEVWHVDSYDKMKPYGICINACIDGYSRKIIWANLDISTNDPCAIANNYIESVDELKASPQKIRVDAGTENVHMKTLHEFLTDDNAVLVGESTANTRIESWWAQYRRQNSEYFISMFHGLKEDGHFTGDKVDKELIRFCFSNLIQVRY